MQQPTPLTRTLKAATIVILVMALLLPSMSTAAPPEATDRSEEEQMALLLAMLGAHEYTPKARVLARIGSAKDVTRLLIYISDYRRYRPTIRVRALASLYLFPNPDVKQYLLSVVHERGNIKTSVGTLLRKQSLRSLGRGFGGSVVPELVAVRTDSNAQIREGVAHALGDTGSQTAVSHLQAWLPTESELFVRLAIDRALETIRKGSR